MLGSVQYNEHSSKQLKSENTLTILHIAEVYQSNSNRPNENVLGGSAPAVQCCGVYRPNC